MCGVVVQGETVRTDVITGIDPWAEKHGSEDDPDFIKNNTGPGKLYPMGPSCTFKGYKFPARLPAPQMAPLPVKSWSPF